MAWTRYIDLVRAVSVLPQVDVLSCEFQPGPLTKGCDEAIASSIAAIWTYL
ncbi:hypothetical protein [Mesorhizobium sp.]|uniref:hypothetical protein n=1 Tax=Mesorhizobium sp. TaxID=1871066 RepID=UPI0025ECE72A|nr:hypothetical protein [Mesorhizobium sp.]